MHIYKIQNIWYITVRKTLSVHQDYDLDKALGEALTAITNN
jgi:hypothetical protein